MGSLLASIKVNARIVVPLVSELKTALDNIFDDPSGLGGLENHNDDLLERGDLLDALDAHLDELEVSRVEDDVCKLDRALVLEEVEPVVVVSLENVLDRQDYIILVVPGLHGVEQLHH